MLGIHHNELNTLKPAAEVGDERRNLDATGKIL